VKSVVINTEYITLGQFLKMTDFISSGGEAKLFLSEIEVFINGEPDDRRGRKLRNGDILRVHGNGEFIIRQQNA
jgi:ribosome-associated protein